MKNAGRLLGAMAMAVIFFSSLATAQNPDFSGNWTGKTVCPVGPVEFTMKIQGETGSLKYLGYGPQQLYATEFPVRVTFDPSRMYVHFAGPDQGANFGSFQGTLLADGTVDKVSGLQANEGYCDEFRLFKNEAGVQSRESTGAPSFTVSGLANESLFTRLFQGEFSRIDVPTDHPIFNSLYGSYLNAYARACAAEAEARPANSVEMTNLECGDERITATFYSNGMYTESAPYCARWDEVPNGLYADPQLWEVKKQLDAVFLGDTYNNIFAFLKSMDSGANIYQGVFEASPQMILSAMTTVASDMDALLALNACDSPGLMRFQENLRLYAINRPFGIRLNGSPEAPIPIPAPGTNFVDPDYGTLLEDFVKSEARSWQANRYLLKSISNSSVTSRDAQGRPAAVTAGYRFGGLNGMADGSVILTFYEGYPECLYFFDKPDSCRSPNKEVTARYIHGGYAPQNMPATSAEENRVATEKAALEREERRKARQQLRQ